MDAFKLGDSILTLLNAVFRFWNSMIDTIYELLAQSPTVFKGGSGWAVVTSVEPIFVAVGSSLVILFFVISFCSESVNIREEMRFENILRSLIRVGLAEWLVSYNLTIIVAIFRSIGALISLLGNSSFSHAEIGTEEAAIISELDFGPSLIVLLIAAIFSLVIIVCAFFMLYTVYFRFLRILVIVPLGALAMSTVSAGGPISMTGVTYFKHFLGVMLEGVTMVLAILVCNALISAGVSNFGGTGSWSDVLIYLSELTFTVVLTVGMVKGAQSITSKALGL